MLFQVGGQGARPTFFEMAAAQQLPSSLRAALTYSLGVSVFVLSLAQFFFCIQLSSHFWPKSFGLVVGVPNHCSVDDYIQVGS
jgi:hypothetical protein